MLVLVAGVWNEANGCSCGTPKPPAQAAAAAIYVFTGRVTSMRELSREGGFPTMEVHLNVGDTYVGDVKVEATIYTTGDTGITCGFPFEANRNYLVYGYEWKGEIWTSHCNRTRLLEYAQMDVAALRARQAPTPSEPYIYFSTQAGNAIHRVTLAGDNLTKVIDLEAEFGEEGYASHGIAISASTMVWSGKNSIYIAGLDGSNFSKLIGLDERGGPIGDHVPIAISYSDFGLYWTEEGHNEIYSAYYDEAFPIAQDFPMEGSPRGIVASGRNHFWLDAHEETIQTIQRFEPPRTLIDFDADIGAGDYSPVGIAMSDSSILWTDQAQDAIYTANFDGSEPSKLVDLDSVFGDADYAPTGVAVDGTQVYWADSGQETDAIYSATINGRDPKKLVGSPTISRPTWIAIYSPNPRPSALTITDIRRQFLDVEIDWRSVPGTSYQVEFSHDLSGDSWEVVGWAFADLTRTTWKHENADKKSGYYRIRTDG